MRNKRLESIKLPAKWAVPLARFSSVFAARPDATRFLLSQAQILWTARDLERSPAQSS